jgi:hypothetical protein
MGLFLFPGHHTGDIFIYLVRWGNFWYNDCFQVFHICVWFMKLMRLMYEAVSKSCRTESIAKCTLTTINTRWETTQRVMAAKLTRLTHKIVIQLHLVAERCNISSPRSRQPVQKLLDTLSYMKEKKCHVHALLRKAIGYTLADWVLFPAEALNILSSPPRLELLSNRHHQSSTMVKRGHRLK